MVFSCLAYFLVENKEPEDADSKLTRAVKRSFSNVSYFFVGNKKSKDTGSKTTSPKGDDESTSTGLPKDGYVEFIVQIRMPCFTTTRHMSHRLLGYQYSRFWHFESMTSGVRDQSRSFNEQKKISKHT